MYCYELSELDKIHNIKKYIKKSKNLYIVCNKDDTIVGKHYRNNDNKNLFNDSIYWINKIDNIRTYYIRPPSIINYIINIFEIYQSLIPIKM